jgi:hypothetical protein
MPGERIEEMPQQVNHGVGEASIGVLQGYSV